MQPQSGAGVIHCTTVLFGLLIVLLVIGKSASITLHPPLISYDEFLGMYVSNMDWEPEIKHIRRAFPLTESRISREAFAKLLWECLLIKYGDFTLETQAPLSASSELGDWLRMHTQEYVHNKQGQADFGLQDAYTDLFAGGLREWLLNYHTHGSRQSNQDIEQAKKTQMNDAAEEDL